MKRLKVTVGLVVLFTIAASARAQDLRQQYTGKSSCAAGIKGAGADYGMRLDKTQNAYLEARTLTKSKILLIIQYDTGDFKCGTIRDLVQIRDLSKAFGFTCVNHRSPAGVVVGTMKEDESRQSWIPSAAWQINLQELKFNRIRDKVSCINESYAGSDDGSDDLQAFNLRHPAGLPGASRRVPASGQAADNRDLRPGPGIARVRRVAGVVLHDDDLFDVAGLRGSGVGCRRRRA